MDFHSFQRVDLSRLTIRNGDGRNAVPVVGVLWLEVCLLAKGAGSDHCNHHLQMRSLRPRTRATHSMHSLNIGTKR